MPSVPVLAPVVFVASLCAPALGQEAPRHDTPLQRAFSSIRDEDVLPCDTWVALPDATSCGHTILAKNSDRLVFDCQPLFLHPRRTWPADATIDLGRASIPQVRETFATLGSSPYWCWGYEEGINEFGVAIGNEGIFTRGLAANLADRDATLGPTGMDLMRLTLERSRSAEEAVRTLGALLEQHGQFGSGLPGMPDAVGSYDNSYIVADAKEAFVLETCGRRWVARRHTTGTTSISNAPSIGADWDLGSADLVEHAQERGWWPIEGRETFSFAEVVSDPSPARAVGALRARTRSACSAGLLGERTGDVTPRWMMRIARDRSTNPSLDLDQTASSCVAVLPAGAQALPVFWWTAGIPSNGCYVPYFVHGAGLPEHLTLTGTAGRAITSPASAPKDGFAPESSWWRFRALSDLVRMDYPARNPIVRAAFDPLEQEFEAGLPQLLEEAAALRAAGKTTQAATLLADYSAACAARALETLDALTEQLRAAQVQVPDALRPYIGSYQAKLNQQEMHILVQSGKLAVKLPDDRIFELLEENDDGRWVFALTDAASVSFDREGDGPVTAMHFYQGAMSFELTRLEGDG